MEEDEYGFEGEPLLAKDEEVLKALPEQLHDQVVVITLATGSEDLRET